MLAAVETDIVYHRTARWDKDRKRKPGKAASQAEQSQAEQESQ